METPQRCLNLRKFLYYNLPFRLSCNVQELFNGFPSFFANKYLTLVFFGISQLDGGTCSTICDLIIRRSERSLRNDIHELQV